MLRHCIFAAFLLLFFLPSQGLAHKVIVFAYMEGSELVVEGGFPGGKPAVNTRVELRDSANDALLASGETNDSGIWRTPLPQAAAQARQGLTVVLDAGEGHRAQWKLAPDEYLQHVSAAPLADSGQVAAQAGNQQAHELEQSQTSTAAGAQSSSATQPQTAVAMDEGELRRLVADTVTQSVSRELAPLRRQLLKQQEPSLRDVLGGVGYIIGLAGLVAWARSRKS